MRRRSVVLGTVTHPQQGHHAACASLPGALLTRTPGTLTVYELPQFYFPFVGSPPGTHRRGCAWDGVAWRGKEEPAGGRRSALTLMVVVLRSSYLHSHSRQ